MKAYRTELQRNMGGFHEAWRHGLNSSASLCRSAERSHDGLTRTLLSLVLLVGCLGSGCVTANFTKPVASLKSSIDTASSAVGSYFTELNSFERDLYFEERAFNPELRVEKTDAEGKPTPLVGRLFTSESIEARMDAIALLGTYADRLAELAGSDAPKQFSSSAQALGTNVSGLIGTFGTLTGSDPSARDYIGPVSQIIGLLGEFYLEKKRDALLERAIKDGAAEVSRVLDLLESDLQKVVVPLRRTGIAQSLAIRVVAYNNTTNESGKTVDAVAKRAAMTVSERQELLEGIKSAAQQYDLLIAFNPTEAIAGIRDAHAALLKYAKSDRRPRNFSELMSAVEALQLKAERVAAAVQQIRELRKGK
jgi:hypothetical protein